MKGFNKRTEVIPFYIDIQCTNKIIYSLNMSGTNPEDNEMIFEVIFEECMLWVSVRLGWAR